MNENATGPKCQRPVASTHKQGKVVLRFSFGLLNVK